MKWACGSMSKMMGLVVFSLCQFSLASPNKIGRGLEQDGTSSSSHRGTGFSLGCILKVCKADKFSDFPSREENPGSPKNQESKDQPWISRV